MTKLQPYPGIAEVWRARYGGVVRRVALDGGLGCPNREKGPGCAFCDPRSFSAAAGDVRSIAAQVRDGADYLRRRGVTRFAAYFQPGTNTHAPPEVLTSLWRQAVAEEGVVALCIGTRPDCLPDAALDALAPFARKVEVWLEIGLQSAHDATLARLSRGHTAADFADAARRARARGICVAAHVILGLPGEGEADEAATADFLARCGVEGIKLHQLAVVEGTALAEDYRAGRVEVFTEAEYIRRAVAFLRRLSPKTVLHRMAGDTLGEGLLAPRLDKSRLGQRIREGLLLPGD